MQKLLFCPRVVHICSFLITFFLNKNHTIRHLCTYAFLLFLPFPSCFDACFVVYYFGIYEFCKAMR